eukprot:TRINITY_DN5387_c0_g1_i5.p1 TRINITY_DN5387_c0_g1~~TRINITY_DN5387_c0_g1_i5.p1  ORF type:complete len:1141 (+),score=383.28 TRINITY_DN5387_c0_g1_i5:164-3424(+)
MPVFEYTTDVSVEKRIKILNQWSAAGGVLLTTATRIRADYKELMTSGPRSRHSGPDQALERAIGDSAACVKKRGWHEVSGSDESTNDEDDDEEEEEDEEEDEEDEESDEEELMAAGRLQAPQPRPCTQMPPELLNKLLFKQADFVIADEAHAIKNKASQTTRALHHFSARRRVACTGTPFLNRSEELMQIIEFVAPGRYTLQDVKRLQGVESGASNTASRDERIRGERVAAEAVRHFRALMHRRTMAVLKGQLPPLHIQVLHLRLAPLQQEFMAACSKHILGEETAEQVLQRQMGFPQTDGHLSKEFFRFRTECCQLFIHPGVLAQKALPPARRPQAASGAELHRQETEARTREKLLQWMPGGEQFLKDQNRLIPGEPEYARHGPDAAWGVHSAKLTALGRIVAEARRRGEKVLVFSFFLTYLEEAKQYLLATEACGTADVLHGECSSEKRSELCADMQDGNLDVLFITLGVGGMGLTLTKASRVVMLEVHYNLADVKQAIYRAYRIGQTREVFSYVLAAEGTFEESMLNLSFRKDWLSNRLVDDNVNTRDKLKAQRAMATERATYTYTPAETDVVGVTAADGERDTLLTTIRDPAQPQLVTKVDAYDALMQEDEELKDTMQQLQPPSVRPGTGGPAAFGRAEKAEGVVCKAVQVVQGYNNNSLGPAAQVAYRKRVEVVEELYRETESLPGVKRRKTETMPTWQGSAQHTMYRGVFNPTARDARPAPSRSSPPPPAAPPAPAATAGREQELAAWREKERAREQQSAAMYGAPAEDAPQPRQQPPPRSTPSPPPLPRAPPVDLRQREARQRELHLRNYTLYVRNCDHVMQVAQASAEEESPSHQAYWSMLIGIHAKLNAPGVTAALLTEALLPPIFGPAQNTPEDKERRAAIALYSIIASGVDAFFTNVSNATVTYDALASLHHDVSMSGGQFGDWERDVRNEDPSFYSAMGLPFVPDSFEARQYCGQQRLLQPYLDACDCDDVRSLKDAFQIDLAGRCAALPKWLTVLSVGLVHFPDQQSIERSALILGFEKLLIGTIERSSRGGSVPDPRAQVALSRLGRAWGIDMAVATTAEEAKWHLLRYVFP